MNTFEEAVQQATNQEHHEVAAIKRTFVEPLAELKKLRTQWAKTHAEFLSRLSRAQSRVQRAVSAGVKEDQAMRLVKPFLKDLQGDGAAMPGLLPSIGPQIESGIANMEHFDAKQVPLRVVWLSWPNIPSRVRDNIRAAESRLDELEVISKPMTCR